MNPNTLWLKQDATERMTLCLNPSFKKNLPVFHCSNNKALWGQLDTYCWIQRPVKCTTENHKGLQTKVHTLVLKVQGPGQHFDTKYVLRLNLSQK